MCEFKLEYESDYTLLYNHLALLSFLKDFEDYPTYIKDFYSDYYKSCINELDYPYLLSYVEMKSTSYFKHCTIDWFDNGDFDSLFLNLNEDVIKAIIEDKQSSLKTGAKAFIDKLIKYDDFINWDLFLESLEELVKDKKPSDYELDNNNLFIMKFYMLDTIRQIHEVDKLIQAFMKQKKTYKLKTFQDCPRVVFFFTLKSAVCERLFSVL